MAVSFTAERAEFVDAVDRATYDLCTTTGAFTPSAGGLLVALVLGAKTADATFDLTNVTSTGMSLTWTQYGTVLTWTNTQFYRLHILTAPVGGSPASVTAVNANWDQTILATDGWIGEWSGANTTTPIKQLHSVSNASGTDPTDTLSVSADSDSATLGGALTRRNPPGWTPAGAWTEQMDNGVSTPVTGLWVITSNATPPASTFTSSGTNALNLSFIMEIDAAPPPASLLVRRRTTAPATRFIPCG